MPLGFADTITLKNGRVINGTYLGGTARTIRVDDGNNVQTLDVSEIQRIEFGSDGSDDVARFGSRPQQSADAAARRVLQFQRGYDNDRPVLRRPENVMRPRSSAPAPRAVAASGTLPAGTNLVIRMIDAVDSETNRVGQTFRASLDQPVMVDGETGDPARRRCGGETGGPKDSGKLTGRDRTDAVAAIGDHERTRWWTSTRRA